MTDFPNISTKATMALLLLLSLAEMPEDYHLALRFIALLCYGWLILRAIFSQKHAWTPVWAVLLLVFNPFWFPEIAPPLWRLITLVAVVLTGGSAMLDVIASFAAVSGKRRRNPKSGRPAAQKPKGGKALPHGKPMPKANSPYR
jgi:hypothetical protein